MLVPIVVKSAKPPSYFGVFVVRLPGLFVRALVAAWWLVVRS